MYVKGFLFIFIFQDDPSWQSDFMLDSEDGSDKNR